MTNRGQQEEIDFALQLLVAPRGGEPGAVAARDEAMRTLMAAPGLAQPRLLELAAGSHPPPLILLALARLGQAEAVPALESALLEGDGPTSVIAAQALAQHPSPAAGEALERAIDANSDQIVLAAAKGIAQRGDIASIPLLRAALDSWPPGEIRDAIIAALASLEDYRAE